MFPNHFVVQKERCFFKPQQVQVRHQKLSGLLFLSVIIWSDISAHCVCLRVIFSKRFGCFCKAPQMSTQYCSRNDSRADDGVCCLWWGCSCMSQRSYVNMYVKLLEAKILTEHKQSWSGVWQRFQSHVVHYSLKLTACKNVTNGPFWFMSERELWVNKWINAELICKCLQRAR